MTADVAIGIREHRDVLLIPVAALRQGQVQVRRAGRTETVDLEVGVVGGEMAEVVAGDLREGEQLVIAVRPGP